MFWRVAEATCCICSVYRIHLSTLLTRVGPPQDVVKKRLPKGWRRCKEKKTEGDKNSREKTIGKNKKQWHVRNSKTASIAWNLDCPFLELCKRFMEIFLNNRRMSNEQKVTKISKGFCWEGACTPDRCLWFILHNSPRISPLFGNLKKSTNDKNLHHHFIIMEIA